MHRRRLAQLSPALLFTALWLSFAGQLAAESVVEKIDALLRSEFEQGRFNGVVLAAEDGRIAYHAAFGDASADGDVALERDSIFRLASVAKAFTGMAVAILIEEGKVGLNDDVRKYLPEFPYEGIEIRHLLHHTSGLPDYVTLLEAHWDVEHKDQPEERKIARSPDALRLLIKHKPEMHFQPGEKWEYSNTGYITLGLVVERVSGKPFGQFLRQRIFRPSGMNRTLLFNPKKPPKLAKRAYGFVGRKGNRKPNDGHFLNGMYGDGEVYSTAEELLKWDQALYSTKLLPQMGIDRLFTPGKLNNGESAEYGFGWNVEKKYGHRVSSHGGGWVGFRTWVERDVDAKRTLIILTNNSSRSFGKLKAQLQPLVFESEELIETTQRKVAWQDSRVRGRPEPPLPYRAEVAFPNLRFKSPTTLTNAPRTSRLFAAQVVGEIVSFPDQRDCEKADAFLDLRDVNAGVRQAYGMTFHPQYPEQPYVYAMYVLQNGVPDGSVISRFTVQTVGEAPPTADPASEKILFRWLSGGHNGCCLKFGPDGFLYVSTGDGAGPNPPDTLRAGQDLSNVLSTIMRIDVDHEDPGKAYAIPADNPFVDLENACPEIYAFGFRNPWKMSFDRETGDLWVGDVGWDLFELVFRVQRGGNYGWSIVEGSNSIHPTWPRGPGPILPPVIEHHHSEARSITGGYVYHGKKNADLKGAYVYGDYNTGKIWALRANGDQPVGVRELTDTTHQIVGWCETNGGELYYADYQRSNQIYELVPNREADRSAEFPRTLSKTGVFESVADYAVAPGVEAYEVNASMWEDGSQATRHVAIPETAQIENDGRGRWRFPNDSVAVRTISRELDGVRTRLETQILHFDKNEWRPYSYVWNEAQNEATLAPAEGISVAFGNHEHRVASRVECRICHSKQMRGLLGFTAPQLTSASENALTAEGLFAEVHPLKSIPRLVDPYNENESLDSRARSYLHVNCVSCHRPGGGGPSPIHLDFGQSLEQMRLVNCRPVQGDFGLPAARLVVPGDPMRSVLFYRMSKLGAGHMPHIGAREIDDQGLRLLHDWIAALPAADEPIVVEDVEQLVQSPHGSLRLAWWLRSRDIDEATRKSVLERIATVSEGSARDLLEPFLPRELRKQRLGANFDVDLVLSKTGDPKRGADVFVRKELQCVACHRVDQRGGELGPALDVAGRSYRTPSELLASIVEPSAKVEPDYAMQLVVTADGETISGRVVAEEADHVVLLSADQKRRVIAFADIEAMNVSKISMMPTQLLQSLDAQEAADLLAYLLSLLP